MMELFFKKKIKKKFHHGQGEADDINEDPNRVLVGFGGFWWVLVGFGGLWRAVAGFDGLWRV